MKLETPLVWTYRNTIGPAPTHSYKNNWQNIFYLTGFNADKLDTPNLIEQFSVQDISAPDGRHGTRYHSWEKPELIAERFIRHSTKQDQKIIDPFAGTGTFLIVGSKLQRDVAGSENNIEMLNICTERGCEICEKT
jgi:DNA modification methylase